MRQIADLVHGIETRGGSLRPRQDGGIAVRPKGLVTPTEVEVLTTLREDVIAYLQARRRGVDWSRVGLYQLDRVLEVAVPWSDVRLILAPGCRIARELRATDPKPGRVWCVCEVSDLLLSGVTPEEARKIAETRLTFDATFEGITKGPGSPEAVGVHDEKEGRS